jgi:hypothetical protein
MDGRCFDKWTKALNESPSRRGVIGALAGGLLAGVVGVGGASAACGKTGDNCNNTRDCCRRYFCSNGECKNRSCGKINDECKNDKDCCRRYICDKRKCKRDN